MDYIGSDKDRFFISQTHLWRILCPNRAQGVIYEIFQYFVRIR